MTPISIISLIATGLVFVMWAISMFRVLFGLRRRAIARTGKHFPGPIEALKEVWFWLKDPSAQQERRQLLFMTLTVLFLSYLMSLSSSGAS